MKYLVGSLSDFSILTTEIIDEEGGLVTAKLFECPTAAKMAANKLTLGLVLVPARELGATDIENQELRQRIQDLIKENESLHSQLNDEIS